MSGSKLIFIKRGADTEKPSLVDYLPHDSIPLKKNDFQASVVGQNRLKTTKKTISIPRDFRESALCKAIITFCYTDIFLGLSGESRYFYGQSFKLFFNFIDTAERRKYYLSCLSVEDLPHKILHEFGLALSNRGMTPQSIRAHLRKIVRAVSVVINSMLGRVEERECEHLSRFISNSYTPPIKPDDTSRNPSLSQLFTHDQITREPISCPYLDSELIKSVREFCSWYLLVLQKRRDFLREVELSDGRTLYETLIEKLNSGVWTIEQAPVVGISRYILKRNELEQVKEWSEIYARLLMALTPSEKELSAITRGNASEQTWQLLLWAEPLVSDQVQRQELSRVFPVYPYYETINRLQASVLTDREYFLGGFCKRQPILLSYALNFYEGHLANISRPSITLAELILPSPTEARLMSWLLASDGMQISNQARLRLSDLKVLIGGEVSRVVTANEPNERDGAVDSSLFFRHFKARSNGKSWSTRKYPRNSKIRLAYESWASLVTSAQQWVSATRKGFWLASQSNLDVVTTGNRRSQTHLLFACLPESITQQAWLNHKSREPVNKQAVIWLLSQELKQVLLQSKQGVALRKQGLPISYITISPNAIRESRIIFEETSGKPDQERARYDAHSASMAAFYRQRGVAKERILMSMRGNAQVADKMVEEALAFIDCVEIVDLKAVTRFINGGSSGTPDIMELIEELAKQPERFKITPFGGVNELSQPHSLKLISDEKTAWMLLSYVRHLEAEISRIETNHDEQVVRWLFEHAIYSILYERFPKSVRVLAEKRFVDYQLPYPPIH